MWGWTRHSFAGRQSCTISSATRQRRSAGSAGARRWTSKDWCSSSSMPTSSGCALGAGPPYRAVTRPRYNSAMPAQETENPASAGISPPEAVDVTALFEQLKEELRKAGADSGGSQGLAARSQAERMWAVSAERPIERRRGAKGLVAYALKLVLRPFLRWYVEPLAAEQRSFNDAVLKVVDDLYERSHQAASARDSAARTVAELEERLLRLERRGAAGAAAPQ